MSKTGDRPQDRPFGLSTLVLTPFPSYPAFWDQAMKCLWHIFFQMSCSFLFPLSMSVPSPPFLSFLTLVPPPALCDFSIAGHGSLFRIGGPTFLIVFCQIDDEIEVSYFPTFFHGSRNLWCPFLFHVLLWPCPRSVR